MTDFHALYGFLPLLAVGLDLLLGDPRWLPHPVRGIGFMADVLESLTRTSSLSASPRYLGAMAALLLAGIVGIVVYLVSCLGIFGLILTIYLCSAGLALRCLLAEANLVHNLLRQGQLTEAKVALSMLVSRDTAGMNVDQVRRSLAETLSENLNDGFTAPLFWLCVAGPVGMWVYKTISTLDSMWGYETERYREFGWFAARADDVMGYIPARLTALAMLIAGACMRLDFRQTLKHLFKDARKMESPNAGWPMAAAAWLVGAQMGGPTMYHGAMKDKPLLGPAGIFWHEEQFYTLCTLTFWSAMLLALTAQAVPVYQLIL